MFRLYGLLTAALVLSLVPGLAPAGGGKEKDKDRDFKVEDKLTKDDPRDPVRNAAQKVHKIQMKAGKVYTIDMVSKEFDCFLRLEDPMGKELDQDDDSGGDLNARIIFNCSKDGEYRVICTAFSPEGVGNFVLTVKSGKSDAKTTTAHDSMVGKAAPDFKADFMLNTQAKSLADFKGKVVVLYFWQASSDACLPVLPRLNTWNKAMGKDGLAVVGLTYYHADLGQHVAFDKATGKMVRTSEGSKDSERAALKAFAGHHKIEYPLLALGKYESLQTFDDYSVNGIPQVVLIDRKGMVRSVRAGNESTVAGLESEIKTLLTEK